MGRVDRLGLVLTRFCFVVRALSLLCGLHRTQLSNTYSGGDAGESTPRVHTPVGGGMVAVACVHRQGSVVVQAGGSCGVRMCDACCVLQVLCTLLVHAGMVGTTVGSGFVPCGAGAVAAMLGASTAGEVRLLLGAVLQL